MQGLASVQYDNSATVIKTRTQLNRRLPQGQKLPWPPFGKQWYAGCTTLVVGNAIKAGVRFTAYDFYTNALRDSEGHVSGPSTVLAGLATGVTESLVAVTPFESIKTQLIDDRKSSSPRMRGFLHGSRIIAQEKGLRGFFQGFVPTTLRQGANSGVRFSSYATLRQAAQGYVAPGEKLGALSTFGIGALAGIITVYATMPLDTVKTRMQSIEARHLYKNTLQCAVKIVREESVGALWAGAVPRLARLSMSGGIVFMMYVAAFRRRSRETDDALQVRKDHGGDGDAGPPRPVYMSVVLVGSRSIQRDSLSVSIRFTYRRGVVGRQLGAAWESLSGADAQSAAAARLSLHHPAPPVLFTHQHTNIRGNKLIHLC